MRTGIYFKGKFIEFDPIQLDVNEKCYVVYEPYELESPESPDTFIAEKTREVKHESGAIIHYHIHKPAPKKLKELLKTAKEIIKAPRWKDPKKKEMLKGLKEIIKVTG